MWKIFCLRRPYVYSPLRITEINLGVDDINDLNLVRQKANEIIKKNESKYSEILNPRLVWVDSEPLNCD